MRRDQFTRATQGYEAAFGASYQGRRVLVTGHTGFKGSWLTLWLRLLGAQVFGLSLPARESPNHSRLLALPIDEALIDLRDASAVRLALRRLEPEVIFHLAAQPLVRRSYREPVDTWSSNVMGLVNLLEAVRATPSARVVVNVTSDKCYAPRDGGAAFVETDALGAHDPYSASKACAELVSASYRASYFAQDDGRGHPVALATARAGNVIGGGDWGEERLLPDLVRGITQGVVTTLRNPQATRPWQHVLEPLAGYLRLGQCLWSAPQACAQAWNFGPAPSGHLSVGELVQRLMRRWPAIRCETAQQDALHEAPWLALDCTKAQRQLGWAPVWDIDTALARTAQWYRRLHQHGQVCSEDDLGLYMQDAKTHSLAWTR